MCAPSLLLGMAAQCLQQFSSPFQDYCFFWFGALDESFHSSYGLCAGMVARESCALVSSCSSSNYFLPTTICGNF